MSIEKSVSLKKFAARYIDLPQKYDRINKQSDT